MFFRKLRAASKVVAPNKAAATERDEIIEIIGVLSSPNYPSPLSDDDRNLLSDDENDALYFDALSESWDKTRQWCETARPELIEIALDLAIHPPHLPSWNMDEKDWKHHMTELLGTWACCNPAQWAEKAGPFLSNIEMRPFILSSMSGLYTGAIAFRPLLMPLIRNAERLCVEEQIYLAEAIAGPKDEEAARLLRQFTARVEASQKELRSAIKNLEQHINKKSAD